jgi:hypothetical protein
MGEATAVVSHQALENVQLHGMRPTILKDALPFTQSARVARSMVAASRINVKCDAVEKGAPQRRRTAHQGKVTGVKNDDWCAGGKRRQALSTLAVEQVVLVASTDDASLFVCVSGFLDSSDGRRQVVAIPNHFPHAVCAEAPGCCRDVDRFE